MVKQWSLKACRVNKGLTLNEVAEFANITTKTISNWERGITPISITKFNLLCKLYDVDSSYVRIPTRS